MQRDDFEMDLESQWRNGWSSDHGKQRPKSVERPRTAGVSLGMIDKDGGEGADLSDNEDGDNDSKYAQNSVGSDGRPLTAAGGREYTRTGKQKRNDGADRMRVNTLITTYRQMLSMEAVAYLLCHDQSPYQSVRRARNGL